MHTEHTPKPRATHPNKESDVRSRIVRSLAFFDNHIPLAILSHLGQHGWELSEDNDDFCLLRCPIPGGKDAGADNQLELQFMIIWQSFSYEASFLISESLEQRSLAKLKFEELGFDLRLSLQHAMMKDGSMTLQSLINSHPRVRRNINAKLYALQSALLSVAITLH